MSMELEKGLKGLIDGVARTGPRVPQPAPDQFLRYQRVHTARPKALDGTNAGPAMATIQIDCMAKQYSTAKSLADAVRGILDSYSGAWGPLTCYHVSLVTENDFYDEDGDERTHWVSQRYNIWTDMD